MIMNQKLVLKQYSCDQVQEKVYKKYDNILNFEPNFWHGWKKGDVMFFDWQNTPHSTANCGTEDRPLLKITGTLDDDSFVTIARNTGKIKNIKI